MIPLQFLQNFRSISLVRQSITNWLCSSKYVTSGIRCACTNMANALKTEDLLFEEKPLFVPALNEVRSVINDALVKNFETVCVEIVDCPDLKAKEFSLVESGLCGSPALLEIGGPPYLLPLVNRNKLYDLPSIIHKSMPGKGKVFAVGAGAGPFPIRNTNCEGIYNMSIAEDGSLLKQGSYTSKVKGPQEECVLEAIPKEEQRCALLMNLFLSRGLPGKVLKIKCEKRIGDLNFIETIRKGLEVKYEGKCVGMGGVFLIKRGCVHQHVMRDFSTVPINTDEEVNQWLKFYNMPAQLNALGTLVTNEHDLDLRLQHFHSFSFSNWGGHYHYDTTPDIVEYEAYLNVADRVVRVDRPLETNMLGRD